jgi:hypothetical protein
MGKNKNSTNPIEIYFSKKQIAKKLDEAMEQDGVSLDEFKNQMKLWRLMSNLKK